MRNNGKTSSIDCGGNRSSFDVILSPMVRSLASHNWHMFNLKGGLWNSGGGDNGHQRHCGTFVASRVRF
jgi:hypothetical protein